MTALFYVTMTAFISICVILIGLILIQKGRGGGLASAFGGAGGQTAFGSKTGDVLTWATSIVFGIFVVLAVTLNLEANHIDNTRGAGVNKPVPLATPVLPSNPQSSLPTAPEGEPGVVHQPPVAPTALPVAPTTTPSISAISTPIAPPPTTMPAGIEHLGERVSNMATTLPTTLP